MKHLRADYDSVQDIDGKTSIGEDEPVFLLRAGDPSAPAAVRAWAEDVEDRGGDEKLVGAVYDWAYRMEMWRQRNRPEKVVADVPANMLRP